ncbi:hypothetical protein [Halotalea alkalilenta]|uniref:flagellin N-terminal helical domain-containing protein n=1 Tax=Halotalea alkalilenta TaxID=376489 RepID=UPI00048A291B|nr:hypothetical protein [Halotalea alkalilenta]
MRVSTAGMFQRNIELLQSQQSRDNAALERLATNQRINRPSDDPQGAARVIELTQAQVRSEQYTSSRAAATSALMLQESALTDLTDTLHSARSLLVQAGNGTLDSATVVGLGEQLSMLVDRMEDTLRTRDADGNYLFSGQQGTADPLGDGADAAPRSYRIDDGLTIDGPVNRNQLMSPAGEDGPDLTEWLREIADGLLAGDTDVISDTTLADMDAGIDNVLGIRALGGSRLNQLERLDELSSDRSIARQDEISGLRDVDYAQALSEAAMTSLALEVAMKSIAQSQQLSMFDLLNG